nr:TRAP transporter substrate-binding protein DctP [Marinicella sp. W31]MDC2879249.1 TRAP transporter substrate-binding protein DctP [Marinicella sp. W31]
MSAMLESFGATPVTLQFSEVYPALQRGVASCGVTSPISANSGNWPEVTSYLLPLSVSGSVQGHFMNLDTWNSLSSDEQEALMAQFTKLEDYMWDLAETANTEAIACNTGMDSCKNYKKFDMQLVEITEEDQQRIKDVASEVVLPIWTETCNAVDPTCSQTWNETAGKAAGITIQ